MDALKFVEIDAVSSHKMADESFTVSVESGDLLMAFNKLIQSMRDDEAMRKFYNGEWRTVRKIMLNKTHR